MSWQEEPISHEETAFLALTLARGGVAMDRAEHLASLCGRVRCGWAYTGSDAAVEREIRLALTRGGLVEIALS